MKPETKNTLFNIAHTVIIFLAVWSIRLAVNPDFNKIELYIFHGILGGFIGLVFGGIWEKAVEEYYLKMPSSKGDWANMIISGIVCGVISVHYIPSLWILLPLDIAAIGFVVWYINKMKSRL